MRTRPSVLASTAACLALLGGCATFRPQPLEENSFWERTETRTDGPVTVTVGVLTPRETRDAFDTAIDKRGIQPVFVRIVNDSDAEYGLLPIVMDRDYYSAHEAAWIGHYFLGGDQNSRMDEYFFEHQVPLLIPPRETVEGFVYTNLRSGVKVVTVEVLSDTDRHRFEFIHEVPGLRIDYHDVDFDDLYAPEELVDVDDDGLRAALDDFTCCTVGPDRETPGDPLNIVVVGDGAHVAAAFVRQGWDLTETITAGSSMKTVFSSMFAGEYKTSPISSLYVFERSQDVAFQKARRTVDERNHLRLWLTPIRCEGREVWIGQISRDIGVRMSSRTFVTHKIDPNLDESREYLLQDLAVGQALARFGYTGGVGEATRAEPRRNYTKDPYFTDGFRLVMFLADEPVHYEDTEMLDWEWPDLNWWK